MSVDGAKFDAILLDLSAGVPTYRALDAHKVCRRTFYGLLAGDATARARYAQAKSDGLERLADEILELSNECRQGIKKKRIPQPDIVTKDKNGRTRRRKRPDLVEVTEGDMVERTKLQIDVRKWLLAKLAPKKYGDRLELGGELTQRVVRVKDLTGTKRDE
jgi:hypothetical protein